MQVYIINILYSLNMAYIYIYIQYMYEYDIYTCTSNLMWCAGQEKVSQNHSALQIVFSAKFPLPSEL